MQMQMQFATQMAIAMESEITMEITMEIRKYTEIEITMEMEITIYQLFKSTQIQLSFRIFYIVYHVDKMNSSVCND